jgi:hypothetical protein
VQNFHPLLVRLPVMIVLLLVVIMILVKMIVVEIHDMMIEEEMIVMIVEEMSDMDHHHHHLHIVVEIPDVGMIDKVPHVIMIEIDEIDIKQTKNNIQQ